MLCDLAVQMIVLVVVHQHAERRLIELYSTSCSFSTGDLRAVYAAQRAHERVAMLSADLAVSRWRFVRSGLCIGSLHHRG
jgi:hypothetical protein